MDASPLSILLVPLGLPDLQSLASLAPPLRRVHCAVEIYSGPSLEIAGAYDAVRGQLNASRIQAALLSRFPRPRGKVVGVTSHDLFAPGLSWVFGQAQLQGPSAVISLHRLAEAFYGRTPDPARERRRLATELGHEAGHAFGLGHCAAPRCVMRWSATVEQIEAKGDEPCPACTQRLSRLAREWACDPSPVHHSPAMA